MRLMMKRKVTAASQLIKWLEFIVDYKNYVYNFR